MKKVKSEQILSAIIGILLALILITFMNSCEKKQEDFSFNYMNGTWAVMGEITENTVINMQGFVFIIDKLNVRIVKDAINYYSYGEYYYHNNDRRKLGFSFTIYSDDYIIEMYQPENIIVSIVNKEYNGTNQLKKY